ncbi:MAG: ClbS/DfsB family four-helix bundle protein [Epsilonproteobacteria bacterium]|nr:ClbS/DfsB family four-helix bundle protein [Campylobacterota bacterium]
MARPTNKEALLSLGDENYTKLLVLVEGLPVEALHATFPFEHRDRNVRDVLAHLYHWHLMMLGWYDVGMRGEKPQMPASGYTWRTLPALNQEIWQQCQSISYEEARELLDDSHTKVRALIHKHSDEELFEKKRYKWTGTTSLGAYFVSSTSSHYDWAMKLLRKYKKSLQK